MIIRWFQVYHLIHSQVTDTDLGDWSKPQIENNQNSVTKTHILKISINFVGKRIFLLAVYKNDFTNDLQNPELKKNKEKNA